MFDYNELDILNYRTSRVCDVAAVRFHRDADTGCMRNVRVMGMGEIVEAEHN